MTATASLFSQEWYRLASLRPSLRPGVRISRQSHRGEVWYVLLDPVNGVHQRVNRSAYELVGRLDGRHSCEEIWQSLLRRLGNHAPSQNEMMATMSQMYEANLLSLSTRGDFDQLKAQGKKQQAQQTFSAVNPLSFRVAVWQPGPWLDRLHVLGLAMFSLPGLILWSLLCLIGLLVLGIQWRAFSSEVGMLWNHPYSLLLSWILYPILKTLHEVAHALAVRRFGGDIGEFGIRMLTLLPVPYVDASSSNLFAFKGQRAAVAAAGIFAELGLASMATLLWASLSPGLTKEICLFIIVIGGLSTLAFNANPLLKFDGYYVFTDLLELPNLAQRSKHYWQNIVRRYAFGLSAVTQPSYARGERRWLISYGLASFIYRWVLGLSLVILAAKAHWTLGLAMLGLSAYMLLGQPLYKLANFLLNDPSLGTQRARAIFVTGILFCALLFALLFGKLPATTVAQGVVWASEKTQVRALSAGFVDKLLVQDGQMVKAGQTLAVLSNDDLPLEWNRVQAELTQDRTERLVAMSSDALQMRSIEDKIARLEAELVLIEKQTAALEVRAQAEGRISIPRYGDLVGKFLKKGDQFAQVLTDDPTILRVAVLNHEANRVRLGTESIAMYWPNAQGPSKTAKMIGEVPATVNALPSAALGERGGGRIHIDPQGAEGVKTQEPIFLFDVQTAKDSQAYPGMRAWVRFDHGSESLLTMLYREWRLAFLRHFEK
jgi:putative peptide zinc metalloprotease protein